MDAKDAETQEPQKKLKKDQPSPDKYTLSDSNLNHLIIVHSLETK